MAGCCSFFSFVFYLLHSFASRIFYFRRHCLTVGRSNGLLRIGANVKMRIIHGMPTNIECARPRKCRRSNLISILNRVHCNDSMCNMMENSLFKQLKPTQLTATDEMTFRAHRQTNTFSQFENQIFIVCHSIEQSLHFIVIFSNYFR